MDIAPTILELTGIRDIHGHDDKRPMPHRNEQEGGRWRELFIKHPYDIEFIPKSE